MNRLTPRNQRDENSARPVHIHRPQVGGTMRTKLIVMRFIVAVLAAAAPLLAVTNGEPDGNRHPYVGVAIQPIPEMPGFVAVCSGSALSSTKFLTASHCFDPSRPVFVSQTLTV